ncbi:MAG: hypothetical protein LBS40_07345 [Burkholderiales bacterium]|jgi:hypothetical protein|nr:hypothetical protein [Burkholderiales bacterium]
MEEFHLFSFVGEAFDEAIKVFVTESVENVITAIKPIAKILVALYISFYGWMMMMGLF